MSKAQRVRAMGLVIAATARNRKSDAELADAVREIVDQLHKDETEFSAKERAAHEAALSQKVVASEQDMLR